MSSVVSFGTNTAAKRKRVYYAGDSTIYEGMPLCYDVLATKNILGYDKGAGGLAECQSTPSTTAEGYQNEAKFLRVVNPVNVSTSGGTATAGVIADTEFTGTELPGVGTHVAVTGTNMTDGVYEVTAVSDGVSITVDTRGADVTGTSATVILNNMNAFAGVVAHGGRKGNTGPCWLDIFVPNGAIVPVRTDANCLVDQTILAVSSAQQELGTPLESDARPVAIAKETVDRGTAGLVLAQLCPEMFIYQNAGANALSIDDADTTTATMVNHINLNFLGSATYTKGLYAVGQLSGAGACAYGMWKFRTYVNAALTGNAHTLCANLHLKEAAELTDTPEYASSALYVTVETDSSDTPDLSGGSLAAIYVGYYVDESGGAPAKAYVVNTNSHASYGFDGLLRCQNAADITFAAKSSAAVSHVIPIDVAGTAYYIMVSNVA